MNDLVVWRALDKLWVFIRLLGNLGQNCHVLVNVILGVGLAWLQRERLRDDPGMVAHPIVLKAVVCHSSHDILSAHAGILIQFLPTVTHLLQPAFTFRLPDCDTRNFPQLLLHVVVVKHRALGGLSQPIRAVAPMVVIGILSWPGLARVIRAQVLSLREMEYVTAARALGATDRRILFFHILPGTLPYVAVAATLGLASAILIEAALNFLGLGVQIPTPTWGNMMTAAQSIHVIQNQPWLWLPPGLAIALTVLAVNFIGDGLRDALDPRIRID